MAIRSLRMLLLLAAVSILPPAAYALEKDEEATWSALREGRYIVLMRHAQTDPGIGDPPGFAVDDCKTQRNLSAQGRGDAKRIGDTFSRRRIPVAEVLSSRWCRCIDTARIAFGKVAPVPMLDSMFNDDKKPAAEKMREMAAAAQQPPAGGNRIWVTHAQNIQNMTGVSVSSGEMLVVAPDREANWKVVGRLSVPRP